MRSPVGWVLLLACQALWVHQASPSCLVRGSLPTPIQAEAVPLILGGGDVMAAAETGSGKTGAFALPVLQVRARPRGLAKKTVNHGCSSCF